MHPANAKPDLAVKATTISAKLTTWGTPSVITPFIRLSAAASPKRKQSKRSEHVFPGNRKFVKRRQTTWVRFLKLSIYKVFLACPTVRPDGRCWSVVPLLLDWPGVDYFATRLVWAFCYFLVEKERGRERRLFELIIRIPVGTA